MAIHRPAIEQGDFLPKEIKDRDCTHVILLEDGSYWMAGSIDNKGAIMSTLNLSSATFLPFEDACYKADKLREKILNLQFDNESASTVALSYLKSEVSEILG